MTNSESDERPVLLEVRDIVVHYGRIEALHGVSLQVRQGELVTLLGANGAGKTTMMRAISGLRPLSSGSVWFDGRDITRVKAHQRVIDGLIQAPEGRGVFPGMIGSGEPRNGLLRKKVRQQGRAPRAAGLGARDLPPTGRAAHPGRRHAVRR